jgi:hypothetical protein
MKYKAKITGPDSTMKPGLEWLTNPLLKGRLIDESEVIPEEGLQPDEIVESLKKIKT